MSTETGDRFVYYVGSFPGDNAESAMNQMIDGAEGQALLAVSDGETDTRSYWVGKTAYEQLMDPNSALEPERVGNRTSYEDTTIFRPKPGRVLTPNGLINYVGAVPESFEQLLRLREEHDRPGLALQVGMPGPDDHARYIMGDERGLEHMGVFMDAQAEQIRQISRIVGKDGIIQLETPATLVTSVRPEVDQPDLRVPAMVARLATLAERAPDGTRFGLHLCLGDMNNETQTGGPLVDGEAVVEVVREVAQQWPRNKWPEYIHFPLAGGHDAPLDPAKSPDTYDGLRGLRAINLRGTHIFAGIAHEAADLATQRATVRAVEDAIDQPVGIATACGLARRTNDTAHLLMRRMVELART